MARGASLDEIEQSGATKDPVETVVTPDVQGLRVELSDKLTMQFHWSLGWLAVVTVGVLLDLLR